MEDQAGVGVEQEGAEGGDGPSAAAVADEAWTWRQDRELFDEIVDEGLRQGLSEAEAQQQAAAAFGGKVPPPMQEPATHLA